MECFCVLLVIQLLVFGKAFSQPDTATTDEDQGVKVAEASNLFGLRLYKRLAQEQSSFVICPLSLSSVLSMVFFGCKGDTASELNLTLGYDEASLGETELLDAYKQTLDVLNTPHTDYQLKMANSMWVRDSIQLNKHYEEMVTDAFEAEIHETNFTDSSASECINDWVSVQTNGKIPELFGGNLDPRTALLLLNAVYFKGTWHTKFDPKETYPDRFFHDGNSKYSEVPMMTVSSSFRYYSSDELKVEVIELPYAGHDVSMIVILPREGITLSTFEKHLRPVDLYALVSNMTEHKVLLTLPKFKLERTLDLKSTLKDLGIKTMFSSSSDLSGISNAAGLTVSDVIQKTRVEVNEEGSEAAAATSLIFSKKKSSGKRVMVVNRPFMFVIGHIPSGSMLFLGRVIKIQN